MLQKLSFAIEAKKLDDATATFEGYASVFGVKDLGGDVVAKGAFKDTLKARGAAGVKMLADHDPRARIGVWEDIKEDDRGLFVRGRLLVEKQIGKDAYVDMKSGALDALSIGYITREYENDGRRRARVLKAVDLMEISLVTFPMNEDARITGVKSIEEMTIRDLEDALASGMLPALGKQHAKALLSGGFKALAATRDAGARHSMDEIAALLRHNIQTLKG